jgi:putative two-component system response regulator
MRVIQPRPPIEPLALAQLEHAAADVGALLLERRAMRVALDHAHREVLARLCRAAAYKDGDTSAHLERIGFLSAHLARLAGLAPARCRMLRDAAPMHDIGKIGIPDAILKKPDPLTNEEWIVMRQHPKIGAELLSNSGIVLLDMAASIALTHHEQFNGRGYPAGRAGEDIPIEGRIVAIVDYFDALSVDRVYRAAWPLPRVLESIREERGQRFDPVLVDIFLDAAEQFEMLRDSIDKLVTD